MPIARRPDLMARTRSFRSLVVAGLALVGAAAPSRAHEGEDHGGAAPAAATGAAVVTTAAMTGRFEVVLKHAPVRGGQPYAGTLYLADYATNRPVAGATVAIAALGAAGTPFSVEATAEPGVYAVTRAGGFPADGRYDVTVTVSAGGARDLVLLSGLYVGPAAEPAEPAAAPDGGGAGGVPWLWILTVSALAVGLALFLVRSARQRRNAPPPTVPDLPASDLPAPVPAAPSRRPESEPSFP